MQSLQPLRGMHDLIGDDMRRHRHVVETFRSIAERYGFQEMETPLLELSEVFHRTLGEASDIVTKETYSFEDRGGDLVTLRPEFTAGVARAVISHGLYQKLPLKFYCLGPNFRYERPQKGRTRQFHQVNVELIGIAEPVADIEMIALGADLLDRLGLLGKTTLELNTLGDPESRLHYRDALVTFFSDHRAALSEESRVRLERNPLRILDSKDEGDRKLIAEAPRFSDYLNNESLDFFAAVRSGLDALGIAYVMNERLVRGLDYYTHTAFEFTTEALGAQGTVLAGGRYDGLIETMGGPSTPAVGWAAGVERSAMMLERLPEAERPIAVVPIGDGTAVVEAGLSLARRLRRAGFVTELFAYGSMRRRMRHADRVQARAALILGEDECARGAVALRDLGSGAQEEVAVADIETRLAPYR